MVHVYFWSGYAWGMVTVMVVWLVTCGEEHR